MIGKTKSISFLVAASMLIYGLGAPAATAVEMRISNGAYSVLFDAAMLPVGLNYDLNIDGTLYPVTSLAGTDNTYSGVTPNYSLPFAFPDYVYDGSETRYHRLDPPIGSPQTINSDYFPINQYYSVEYLVTFDQTGLPPGTPYSVNWRMPADPIPLVAGTPSTDWLPGTSYVSVYFPRTIYTALGQYDAGGIIGPPPSDSNGQNEGSYLLTAPSSLVIKYVSGSVAGTVFLDYNNNGVQDPGEPGVPNAKVELIGMLYQEAQGAGVDAATPRPLPTGPTTLMTEQSDGNGDYSFDFLPAGTFSVRITLPGGGVQESGAITLAASNGSMSSSQADFAVLATLPYAGK